MTVFFRAVILVPFIAPLALIVVFFQFIKKVGVKIPAFLNLISSSYRLKAKSMINIEKSGKIISLRW